MILFLHFATNGLDCHLNCMLSRYNFLWKALDGQIRFVRCFVLVHKQLELKIVNIKNVINLTFISKSLS